MDLYTAWSLSLQQQLGEVGTLFHLYANEYQLTLAGLLPEGQSLCCLFKLPVSRSLYLPLYAPR